MKRIIFVISILITLFGTTFASFAQKEQLTLEELIGIKKDEAKTVMVQYSVGLDSHAYEVDKDKFYSLAQNITLEEIEQEDNINKEGIWFVVNGKSGIEGAYISTDSRVSKSNPFHSYVPYAEHKMSFNDLIKLYELLPDEANEKELVLKHSTLKVSISLILSVLLVMIFSFITGYLLKKKR